MSNSTDKQILRTAIAHLQALPPGEAVGSLLKPFNEAIEQLHAGPGHLTKEYLSATAAIAMVQDIDRWTVHLRSEGHAKPPVEPGTVGVGLVVNRDYIDYGTKETAGPIRIMRAYPGYPAALAGIRPMDLLLSINGHSTSGFSINQVVDVLQNEVDSETTLVVERAGQKMTFRVINKPLQAMAMVSRLLGRVAYLQVSSFWQGTAVELRRHYDDERREAAGPLSGVILDLRLNQGPLLNEGRFDFHRIQGGTVEEVVKTASEFLPQSALVAIVKAREAENDRRLIARGGDMTSGLPMIVLVDGYTSSGSELLAGALQDNGHAIIVGSHTAGLGTIQTLFEGTNPWITILTTARIALPSGRMLQPSGIVPDIELKRYVDGSVGTIAGSKVPDARILKTIAQTPGASAVFYDLDHPERDFQVLQAVRILTLLHPPH